MFSVVDVIPFVALLGAVIVGDHNVQRSYRPQHPQGDTRWWIDTCGQLAQRNATPDEKAVYARVTRQQDWGAAGHVPVMIGFRKPPNVRTFLNFYSGIIDPTNATDLGRLETTNGVGALNMEVSNHGHASIHEPVIDNIGWRLIQQTMKRILYGDDVIR